MARGFIDIDDILNKFFASFFVWHNLTYKTNIQYEHLVNYQIVDILGLSQEQAEERIVGFCSSDDFLLMKPDQDAVVGIYSLHYSGHELHVLTSRHDDIRDHTHEWVPMHFAGVFSSILFSSNMYTDRSSGRPKHETLAEMEADFYVEDNLHLVLAAAPYVKYIFMLDRPWNQTSEPLPDNVIRVHNWFEITAAVRSLFP